MIKVQVKLIQNKDLQNDDQDKLYRVLENYIPTKIVAKKNANNSWEYGYNRDYDVVIISRNGSIGQIINIAGLNIALPAKPMACYKRDTNPEEQYWEREELPKPLSKIQTIFQWNEMSSEFKNHWVDYIEKQFDYREEGFWFMNNGVATYMTGSHWMYLQWASIDVGYPDFREANRIYWIFWEACRADDRSFGMDYLKIRRSGFSFMSSSECINIGTLVKDARVGILSKTGADAKKCLLIRLFLLTAVFLFSSNLLWMEWISQRLNWRIVFPLRRLRRRTCLILRKK